MLKPSLSLSAQAAAVPPWAEGWRVFVKTDGPVTATYQGSSADFNNDLYLMLDQIRKTGKIDGNLTNDLLVFNNHSTPEGEARNLGTIFGRNGINVPFACEYDRRRFL